MIVENVPEDEKIIPYTHHPPLTGLMAGLSFCLFGKGEPQVRLIAVILNSLAAGFFSLFFLGIAGDLLFSLAGVLLSASCPLFIYYGDMLDPQGSGILFSMAGVLWLTHSYLRRNRIIFIPFIMLFLLFGFLWDWPSFVLGFLVSMFLLLRKGNPNSKAPGVSLLAFTLLSFLAILLWLSTTKPLEGYTLMESFLARANIRSTGLLEESSLPLETVISKIFDFHVDNFIAPISILGILGSVPLAFKPAKRESPEALILFPLMVGIIHIFVFLQGAYKHDYWQVYLSFGLGMPGAWLLMESSRKYGIERWASRILIIAGLLAFCHGVDAANSRWGERKTYEALKATALVVKENTTNRKRILAGFPVTEAFEFYSERSFYWTYSPEQAAFFMGKYWDEVAGKVEYFICTVQHESLFKDILVRKGCEETARSDKIAVWKIN